MSWRLFIDSDNGISIDPTYAFELAKRLFEDRQTAKEGSMYRYLYGTKEDFKVPVSWVTSNDASIINSWWESGAALMFKTESHSEVYSVQIVNKKTPFAKYVKPYDSFWEGKIELKGY